MQLLTLYIMLLPFNWLVYLEQNINNNICNFCFYKWERITLKICPFLGQKHGHISKTAAVSRLKFSGKQDCYISHWQTYKIILCDILKFCIISITWQKLNQHQRNPFIVCEIIEYNFILSWDWQEKTHSEMKTSHFWQTHLFWLPMEYSIKIPNSNYYIYGRQCRYSIISITIVSWVYKIICFKGTFKWVWYGIHLGKLEEVWSCFYHG